MLLNSFIILFCFTFFSRYKICHLFAMCEHVKPCFPSLHYLPVETKVQSHTKFRYLMLSILKVMILDLAQCAAVIGHSLFKPALCVPQVIRLWRQLHHTPWKNDSSHSFTEINKWCYLIDDEALFHLHLYKPFFALLFF